MFTTVDSMFPSLASYCEEVGRVFAPGPQGCGPCFSRVGVRENHPCKHHRCHDPLRNAHWPRLTADTAVGGFLVRVVPVDPMLQCLCLGPIHPTRDKTGAVRANEGE